MFESQVMKSKEKYERGSKETKWDDCQNNCSSECLLSLANNCQPVVCEGKKGALTKEDRATGVKTPKDLVSLIRSYRYPSKFYLRFPYIPHSAYAWPFYKDFVTRKGQVLALKMLPYRTEKGFNQRGKFNRLRLQLQKTRALIVVF